LNHDRGRVQLSPAATQDIDDLADYLAKEASVETALRFYDAVETTFELLATQPEMGWHCQFTIEDIEDVRVWSVSGFDTRLIFYKPLEDGIHVLRLRHSARKREDLFKSS